MWRKDLLDFSSSPSLPSPPLLSSDYNKVNTVLGKDMDEAWLQDYEQNIKENRQFAHKMAVLQQKITETAPGEYILRTVIIILQYKNPKSYPICRN